MIEVIQEENWDASQERQGIPKDIKQIGVSDAGDRIYIEDNAYQKLHPHGRHIEKMVYVMLGRFDDFAGHTCIFVEDVIGMHEVEFRGNLPIWNEESWGHLYRKLWPEHEEMIIVGWAVDICGQLPNMTTQLERIHQTYFGGVHQVLFLMDTIEREEAFYSNKNGYLKRRTGFYIYYDKTIPGRMSSAMESLRADQQGVQSTGKQRGHREERRASGNAEGYGGNGQGRNVEIWESYCEDDREMHRQEQYREYLNRRNNAPQPPKKESSTMTLMLLVVIVTLCYSAFLNYQKMQKLEMAISQMGGFQSEVQSEDAMSDGVKVEDITGNVVPQTPSTQSSVETVPEEQAGQSALEQGGTDQPITDQSSQAQGGTEQTSTGQPTSDPASQTQGETGQATTTQTLPEQSAKTQGASVQVSPAQVVSEQVTTTPVSSEASAYLEKGYYVVQKGDNLASICEKIYHTTAMVAKLCEVNGIENPDAIYIGQYLELPK